MVVDDRERLSIDALGPAAVESALDRIERDGIAPHRDSTTYEVLADQYRSFTKTSQPAHVP